MLLSCQSYEFYEVLISEKKMRVVLLVLLILAAKVQAADPHSFSNFALVSHPTLALDLTADLISSNSMVLLS